jgi:hypothetical protein
MQVHDRLNNAVPVASAQFIETEFITVSNYHNVNVARVRSTISALFSTVECTVETDQ